MGIRFACHVCNKKLNIKRDLAGRRGVCPACDARFRIPLEDAEKSTPVELVRRRAGPQPVPEIDVASALEAEDSPASHFEHGASLAAGSAVLESTQTMVGEDSEATWYVRPPSGGQYGPATSNVLKQWIAEGRVAATALLWRDGWPQWRDAENVLPELVGQLPAGGVNRGGDPTAIGGISTDHDDVSESSSGATGILQRPKVKQRIRLIGVLAVLAVLLISVLLFVMSQS